MTSKEKKIVFGVFAVLIVVIVVALIIKNTKKDENMVQNQAQTDNKTQLEYAIELDDGTKLNTSKELNSTKKYKDLEISNIQYTSKDGNSELLADVKNVGTTVHEDEIVKLSIIGANGEVITTLSPIIGKVEPGETIKLIATVTADVVNAKDIKIEEKK